MHLEGHAFLSKQLESMGIQAWQPLQTNLIHRYLDLLQQWNQAYNLSGILDRNEMLIKHILDSLSIAQYLQEDTTTCLDFGTGAGLPGIPLAILHPKKHFFLLESKRKKCLFLSTVLDRLGLQNTTVLCARAEALHCDEDLGSEMASGVDCILSRAVCSVKDLIMKTRHLLSSTGYWLAMKGMTPEQDLLELQAQKWWSCDRFEIKTDRLQVPLLEAQRSLVTVRLLSAV